MPGENEGGGGGIEVAENPLNEQAGGSEEGFPDADYIRDTISQAGDRIARSNSFEDVEEPAAAEKKKTTKQPGRSQSKPRVDPGTGEPDEPEPEEDEGEDEGEGEGEGERETEEAKTNARWNAYRTAYREVPKLKAELAELRQKVKAAGDTTEITTLREQVQALSTEREELMRAVEVGSVENGYQWRQQIVGPLDRMWTHTQTIAKRNNLDAGKIVQFLVNQDDVGLEEYMTEARPGDRVSTMNMLGALQEIEERKTYLRQNAHQLSQHEQQQLAAQRDEYFKGLSQQRESAVERILPKIQDRVLALLPQDKRMDLQEVRKSIVDYDNWAEDVKMYGGFAAVVLPDVLDSFKATRAELKAAKAELVKLRGGAPKITTGARTTTRSEAAEAAEEEEADLSRPIREITAGMTNRVRQAMGMRR